MRRLPELATNLYGRLAPWLRESFGIDVQIDPASVKELIAENLDSAQALTLKLLSGLKAGGTVVLGILINLALIPVVMFYLLRDWNRIVARVDGLLPRRWLPRVRTIAREIDRVLAALLQWSGWPGFFSVLAVYGIGQLLENYVLVPLLVGDRIGLHPLAVIFALLAFGELFGFAGVLLALPVSAALLVGLRHLSATYIDSDLYR